VSHPVVEEGRLAACLETSQPGARAGPTTCAELFHTDERLVAFGHLVSVDSRG